MYLDNVGDILSLKPLFHELGYEIFVMYRLIKVTQMPPCYFKDTCGANEPHVTHIWCDLFVMDHSCALKSHHKAVVEETSKNKTTVTAAKQPIRCRCKCFASDLLVSGSLSERKCSKRGENLPFEGFLSDEMMPGACAPVERVMVGEEPIQPYRPNRIRMPFAYGSIWGFENYEDILKAKYGDNWWMWLGNAARHGDSETCRFYQAEQLLALSSLSLRSYSERYRERL